METELDVLTKIFDKNKERIAYQELKLKEAENEWDEAYGRKIIANAPSISLDMTGESFSDIGNVMGSLAAIASEPETTAIRQRINLYKAALKELAKQQESTTKSIEKKDNELLTLNLQYAENCSS